MGIERLFCWEGIMKTILESCYGGYSSPNPVVIFGDFNQSIEEVLIIHINDFLKGDYEEVESLKFKARSIVLMSQPPERLFSHLERLRRAKLWDNLIPFFIISENTAPCTDSRVILGEMWKMEILNSIYICPNSILNRSEIYTLNPITNYAPYPWQRIDELSDLKIFRQNFDANISCAHLTYDKTKILNGYSIVAVNWRPEELGVVPGWNYFDELINAKLVQDRALRTIIIALNASCKYEFVDEFDSLGKRHNDGSADIIGRTYTLESFSGHPYSFPIRQFEIVAVVKLRAEVSSLRKISRLWSTPVLIAVGFTLAIFFLVLMIKRRSFVQALLDIARFLTYVSIQTNDRYQSFKIYFTTMLIFIIISNGVFQSNIAAILTTRERISAVESIHQLTKLKYHMYVAEESFWYAKRGGCPSCEFRKVSNYHVCIELVLNGSKNVCVMEKSIYEEDFLLYPVDRVKDSFNSVYGSFVPRKNWPLLDRFNGMIMRVVESGFTHFWEMKGTSIRKAKRQSLEAERASAQYRPVAFAKLDFAFKLLAAGLSLATIVFLLELCWARFVKFVKNYDENA